MSFFCANPAPANAIATTPHYHISGLYWFNSLSSTFALPPVSLSRYNQKDF
jgi:hypothetical protein